MSARKLLNSYLQECPLIAIIRGVTPDDAAGIGDAIFEGGIRIIEVPLNSPDPLKSIDILAGKFGDTMLVGAGTVLAPGDVERVRDSGGRIIVSPDTNTEVIAAAAGACLVSCPCYFTPSEAFAAIRAGASGLLIGADVRIGLTEPMGAEVVVIGRPDLTKLYAVAVGQSNRTAIEIDGEQCFIAGIKEIARRI